VAPVTTIKEAAEQVDYLVTSLPRTNDVEQVLLSEGGVFASADEGTFICDSSTISPMAAKEFSRQAKEHKMTYCDAPMSGGIMGAANGTLTFMVGAEGLEEFEKAKIVLEGMGKNIIHCGDPGAGEIAKIANNLILGI
jgi:3-hydroxyisobutyrate dehydrogenase